MKSIAATRIAPRLVTAALLSAFVCSVSLHGAEAGVNVWTTNGPEGGTISALAIDPQSPGTVYAGTLFDGVFKSTDGGGHWSAVNAAAGSHAVVIEVTGTANASSGDMFIVVDAFDVRP